MYKTFIMAFTAVALVGPAWAADTGDDAPSGVQRQGTMNPTAGSGAPSNQPPGGETSDRTPDKQATTPESQVDRSKGGETSDRTPSRHKN